MTSSVSASVVNGLDTAALGQLADLLKANPQGGRVTFASHSRWQDGARVLTRISSFRVDGQAAHEEDRRFVLLSDEPAELSGTDAAPGPAEQLMHALASCISATINANAAFMGVTLSRLEVDLEGTIDLHGMFGLDETARPGFQGLQARIALAGEADEATLRDLAQRGVAASPVRDSVENGVPIHADVSVAS